MVKSTREYDVWWAHNWRFVSEGRLTPAYLEQIKQQQKIRERKPDNTSSFKTLGEMLQEYILNNGIYIPKPYKPKQGEK